MLATHKTMADERPTKVLEAGASKIRVKTYITALEAREIYSSVWQQLEAGEKNDEKAIKDRMSGKTSLDLQDKQIEVVVVDIDGQKDDVVKRALNLPVQDFTILNDYIKEVMGEKKSLNES